MPRRQFRSRVQSSRPGLEPLEDRTLPAVFLVTTTADGGSGSLRQAVLDANATAGADTIRFNLPTTAANFVDVDSALLGGDAAADVWVIRPLSALPSLNDATGGTTIDGRTQTTFGGNTNAFGPEVVLDGSLAGAGVAGLTLLSNGNAVFGLNIQRFAGNGVTISGGDQNWVAGCFIGTNPTGTAAAANGGHGVAITAGAQSNLVGVNGDGVSDSAEQNVISGNTLTGLRIDSAGTDGNVVAGNLIGTNAAGTAAVGNGTHGIRITGGARFTRVGTDGGTAADAAEWNIISGNASNGVMIDGATTTQTTVAGNYIGTNGAGTAALPNAQGVYLDAGTSNNTIGNPAFAGNIISGNFFNGVVLLNGATGNLVSANWIGIDRTGAGDLGNTDDGVHVLNAPGNTISGNLISGNNRNGVWLWQSGSTGNVVTGNLIGTDVTGTLDRGNGADGVRIENAPNNTVGAGNVISGNNGEGVDITGTSTGNLIQGNSIGVNATGTAALGNAGDGVAIYNGAGGITVGGTVGGAGNVISGNGRVGVWVAGGGNNLIAGNRIGTNAAGNGAIGNGQVTALPGILLQSGTTNNVIGGTVAAARNVISGNRQHGVQVTGTGTSGNLIRGNYIGTNAAGTAALGNAVNGVQIDGGAANNTVGGSTSASGNLISGNGLDGVFMTNTSGNRVQANYVGTNLAGSAALANGRIGVLLHPGAAQNVIGTDGNGTTDTTEGNLVSGNATHGIEIRGAGSDQNVVAGNLVGTDLNGTADLGNGAFGVFVWDGAQNNRVGTDANGTSDTAERNVISGNAFAGVFLSGIGTTGNAVAGNRIGTNLAGTAGLGNSAQGVAITGGASNNVIGGTAPGTGNLISGNNGNGIEISGSGTTGTVVAGNRIGTNAAGTAAVANAGLAGINVVGSPNTTIGGTTPAERNVISGNALLGVLIGGATATGNQLLGNYIGVGAGGTFAVPNGSDGVRISGTSGNVVGGTDAGAGNVISGNQFDGIDIRLGATNNLVQGNLIGTDYTGMAAVGNGASGVNIEATAGTTAGNTVGGTAAPARNVISGNLGEGVLLAVSGTGQVTGNLIQGNFIGTDLTGNAALGNTVAGVVLRAGTQATGVLDNVIAGNAAHGVWINGAADNVVAGNRIGTNEAGTGAVANLGSGVLVDGGAGDNLIGGSTATGNLISGNTGDGVEINGSGATGTVVAGNRIGTNAAGDAALGNARGGVVIVNASGNRVGGPTPAERNVISGNLTEGVALTGTLATDNVVQGNYIGTDADGAAAVPNGSHGVAVADASNNLIGGAAPGAGNVISGGARDGIGIGGIYNQNNQVLGNLIGLNAAGDAALGNALNGIFVSAGGNNLFRGNVISGNGANGMALTDATTGNRVQANHIGTDAAGAVAIPNTAHGVLVLGGAHHNVVGTDGDGTDDAAEGNVIAFNGGTGVTVTGAGTIGNSVRRNSTHSNAGLGIDLAAGGDDARAAPAVTAAVPGTRTSVAGTVTDLANTTFTIDFYASPTADPSGFGEGKRYLGSITVTTGPSGNATFSVILAAATATGEFVTATATDPDGNTSEFSVAVAARATTQVLVAAVNNLLASGTINQGQANSLLSQLNSVQRKIDHGRLDSAINLMQAFINHVNGLVAGGVLTPDEADVLLDLAGLLIDELGG